MLQFAPAPMPEPTDHAAPCAPALADELNAEQLEAVRHGAGAEAADRRALLVLAGAGSGKTSTLAHRVANLIAHGADPQRLLLLTFSRRAAAEMGRRVAQVLTRTQPLRRGHAPAAPSLPWSGTFHSVGARLLRQYAQRIGLDPSFTVHDNGDAQDLLGLVRHDIGLAGSRNRFPLKGTCLAIYSRTVNSTEPLCQVLKEVFPWCAQWEAELKRLFRAYVQAKQEHNVLDYDDLLLFWAEMQDDPALAQELGARFTHVLVDEYQDTNRLQAAILRGLKPDGCGLTVVGDDAQSIYSFRAATVRNILDFPGQFGSAAARVVTLSRNYRSTQAILDASNAVIAAASERHAKTLWTDRQSSVRAQLVLLDDEAEQARWVATRVLEQREAGLALKSQAVLFRTSTHSAALELELARRDIPFVKFGGLKFLEAAHIKDMLAILRFAQNPRGRLAGFRALQLVHGVGPASATRLLEAMAESSAPGLCLQDCAMPAPAAAQWAAFTALYAALRAPQLPWPADLELACAWYLPQLDRLYDDAAVRRLDLAALLQLAAGYGSRERFVTELTLDPPQSTSDQSGVPHRDEDYLVLSTIHSAKGQEWRAVHVLNVVDGCIPSDLGTGTAADIEEERRLLYVAMTRARDSLHLLVPQRFYVTQQTPLGDRHMYAGRSRFISDAMLGQFEQVAWPAPGCGPEPQAPAPNAPALQVRARALSAWR